MRVAVCACTYRRPNGLQRLLDGLNRLEFSGLAPDVRVVIVDNDTSAAGREVCETMRPSFRWRLDCAVEPRRGITYARNRSVALAGEDIDFIAFIDDDEVPHPVWLDQLLQVQSRFSADVVAGAVISRFATQPPPWIVECHRQLNPRYEDGPCPGLPATNNVLIRAGLLRDMVGPFDHRFALTGGEDTHLFRLLQEAGVSCVWARDALVDEWLPPSRATVRWLLRRAYRIGITNSRIELMLSTWRFRRLKRLQVAALALLRGTLLFVPGALRGRAGVLDSSRRICGGLGLLAGTFGMRIEEYRTTDGA